jgi:L-seryl-tRNA(Ser) seleniumtransferase
MKPNGASVTSVLAELPSVDEVMQSSAASRMREGAGEVRLVQLARRAVDSVRSEILAGSIGDERRPELLERVVSFLVAGWRSEHGRRTRRVINATGVVIHTNLGRAPLSNDAIEAIVREAAGYCTVEYDLDSGKRGKRGERAESLICHLTGAEAAIIVNNCAAAAFLVLSVLAADREVVISRGELVEIGGDFRVPDVLSRSGAILREVGTTNRTKLSDFENAICERTAMLLRVHPSNYRITGFTEMPGLAALAALGRARGVVVYEDAGSGALIDLKKVGLADEPVIAQSIKAGVDVVSFSGDKLLGGPQSGIIAGRRELIDRLRRSPLYRALRVSKLVYAGLEATLESYARSTAETDVPVLKMLGCSGKELLQRTSAFAERLSAKTADSLSVEILEGNSVVGGGAAPDFHPSTSLVALMPGNRSAAVLERRLRVGDTPVITRIQDGAVLIDLRTVREDEEEELLSAIAAASLSE